MFQAYSGFLPDVLLYASLLFLGWLLALLVWAYSPLVTLIPKSFRDRGSLVWAALVGVVLMLGAALCGKPSVFSGVFTVGLVLWSLGLSRSLAFQACLHASNSKLKLVPYLSVGLLVCAAGSWISLAGVILVVSMCALLFLWNPEQDAGRKLVLGRMNAVLGVGLLVAVLCSFNERFYIPGMLLFLGLGIYQGCLFRKLARVDSGEIKEVRAKNEVLKQNNERIFEENETLSTKNTALSEEHKALMQAYDDLIAKNAKVESDLLEQTRASSILDHLKQSVDYARRIQNGVFYSEKEICEAFPEAFILQKPRDVVSGDFIWFSRLNEHEVILAAIDCTGHGVPGAFMTIMGNSLIHTIVNQQGVVRPDQILFLLDRRIRETLSRQGGEKVNDGMDMALCRVNFKSGEILFSGARNPLCVVQNEDVEVYRGTRRSIGGCQRKPVKSSESPYELHRITAKKGQSFYIYSDGFQDQLGGLNRGKYMSKRFRNLLKWNQSQSMAQQKTTLERELKTWQHKEMQTDDILVIGFKVF